MHDDHANPSACQYIHHSAQYHMPFQKLHCEQTMETIEQYL